MKFSDLPIGATFVYKALFELFLFVNTNEEDALKACKEYALEKRSDTEAFSKRSVKTYNIPKDQVIRILE